MDLEQLPEAAPNARRFINHDTGHEWLVTLEFQDAPPGGSPGVIVKVEGEGVEAVVESTTFTDDRMTQEGFDPDVIVWEVATRCLTIAEARVAAREKLLAMQAGWSQEI